MKDKINATFTLSSFYASNIDLNVKGRGPFTDLDSLIFSLDTAFNQEENSKNRFSVTYITSIETKDQSISLKVLYHAVFVTKEPITEELLTSDLVKVNASAIGFPYLRSFISQVSLISGLPAIVLPTINFTQFK